MAGIRPKITVITVVLNQADKLAETMQSVLSRSVADLDYILIDGGSTDGTVEVIKSFADRLKLWVSEPDMGVYDAMNKGWALADPESWILFVGAGDRLLSLPDQMPAKGCPPTILYGNVELAGGKTFHARAGMRLRVYNSLHHQALLVPKALHVEPPFDPVYPLYADYDFNQRLHKQGAAFRFEPLLSAYAAPDGLTRELHLSELTAIIRKNYGPVWSGLSRLGFSLARALPILKILKPIR